MRRRERMDEEERERMDEEERGVEVGRRRSTRKEAAITIH